MKIKLALLLALITSAGLLAQDAPKPDAPKGDAPAKKGEGKGDKGGKKGMPQKPESVDEATWKKFLDAQKAASSDEAVKAAEAKAKSLGKDASEEDRKAAGKAVIIPGQLNRAAAVFYHLAPRGLMVSLLARSHPGLR